MTQNQDMRMKHTNYFGPSGMRALPLGVCRQNVVATLNGVISQFLSPLSSLLFYQKEGS
jgi:hypothetical protein